MKVIRLIFFGVTFSFFTGIGFYLFNNVSHAAPNASPPNTTTKIASSDTPASANRNMGPVSYADAVAIAGPAVVSVKTTKEVPMEMNPLYQDPFRYFFGDPNMYPNNPMQQNPQYPMHPNQGNGQQHEVPHETLQGLGSGVLVDNRGYVLTNYHVVKDFDSITVTLADGRTADAKIVGTDPDTDIAVLQIKLDKLPVITMGSSAQLRPGDVVLAIGNPFGLDKTVTLGIVSATGRASPPELGLGLLENMIQTDAAINPGNSGGALIDATGKLVGINTYIFSRSGGSQGIGFAIPIDQAVEIMNALIAGKHISRGFLGVNLQPLSTEIRERASYKDNDGVFVRAIVNGSPAQKAGLIPGDIITKINNTAITDNRMAVQLVASLKPGNSYPIEIFRKGDLMTFTVTLSERKLPASSTPAAASPKGLSQPPQSKQE